MGKVSHGGFNGSAGSSSSPHTAVDNLINTTKEYPLAFLTCYSVLP